MEAQDLQSSGWLTKDMLDKLKATGQQALASGKITPAQVASHAQSMGVDPKDVLNSAVSSIGKAQISKQSAPQMSSPSVPESSFMPPSDPAGSPLPTLPDRAPAGANVAKSPMDFIKNLMNFGGDKQEAAPASPLAMPKTQGPPLIKKAKAAPTTMGLVQNKTAAPPAPTPGPSLMPGKPGVTPAEDPYLVAPHDKSTEDKDISDQTHEIDTPFGKQIVADGDATNPGASTEYKQTNRSDNKGGTTQNTYMDSDTFGGGAENIRNLPEYKSAQAGADNMSGILKALMMAPPPRGDSWAKPLVALADSLNGSNIMAGWEEGQKPVDRANALLKYADEMQKRKDDLAKYMIEGISKQKSGSITDQLQQMQMQQLAQGEKAPTDANGDKVSQRQDMMDRRDHQNTLNTLQKDRTLQGQVMSLNQLRNGLSLLSTGRVDPKTLQEAQNMIRGAIQSSGGARSTGEERMGTYVNSLGIDWDGLKQYVTGTPQYQANHSDILVHLRQLGGVAAGQISQQMINMMKAKTQGHASMYNRRPDLKGDLQATLDDWANIANPTGSSTSDNVGAAAIKIPSKSKPASSGQGSSVPMVKVKLTATGQSGSIPKAKYDALIKQGSKKYTLAGG